MAKEAPNIRNSILNHTFYDNSTSSFTLANKVSQTSSPGAALKGEGLDFLQLQYIYVTSLFEVVMFLAPKRLSGA